MPPALPLRRTTTGDFFDNGSGQGATVRVSGARLVAAGAAAAAQITDQDGTVLYDLAAPANSADESVLEVRAVRKVTLASISGASAAVTVYVE